MSEIDEGPASDAPSGGTPWVQAALIAGVLAVGLGFILLGESAPNLITRGTPAPSFSLPRLSETAETLSLDDFRGQVVLVNFWATWCKPCEEEMPSMERLYRKLHDQGFEMLAVSVDENPAPVREFQERMGISFPILLDPAQRTSKLYQTMGFPESLLVDRDGVVVERYVGPRDWDHPDFAKRIQSLLSDGRG